MTIYCVRLRFHNTGQINIGRFTSMTERELCIAEFSALADVLDRWEESS